MKQFLQPTKLFVLMLMLTAVFLTACEIAISPAEVTQIPLGVPLISSPTNPAVTEVAVKIVTLEPTPTTAVCTPCLLTCSATSRIKAACTARLR
jgi:hypothetical protein